MYTIKSYILKTYNTWTTKMYSFHSYLIQPNTIENAFISCIKAIKSFSLVVFLKHTTFLLLFRILIVNLLSLEEKINSVRGFSAGWPIFCICCALIFLLFLGVVAFYTLLERKVIAAVQRREGPNVSGPFGILQPVMDGVKLILKEMTPSSDASADTFDLAPIISFTISFAGWGLLPLNVEVGSLINSDYTLMLFLSVSSLGIYGLFLAGWASNTKYALLGAIRAVSQFISYEVFFSLLFIPLILYSGSGSILGIVERQMHSSFFFAMLPLFIVFYITMLVETNRAPFDMPEAEAELVAGFNVEYSSITFALFFLGEYNSMVIASTLMTLLFAEGSLLPAGIFYNIPIAGIELCYVSTIPLLVFILKVLFFCYSFIFVRANFPRVRYDQLLTLGWKVCLPLSLGFVYIVISLFITFHKTSFFF